MLQHVCLSLCLILLNIADMLQNIADTLLQRLFCTVQEASVWLPKDNVHQQQELTVVRLALARSVAQAHINAFRPAITASA